MRGAYVFFCFGVVGAFLHIMGTNLWVGLQSPPLRSAANGRYWCQACPGLASGFWMDDVSDESDVFLWLFAYIWERLPSSVSSQPEH